MLSIPATEIPASMVCAWFLSSEMEYECPVSWRRVCGPWLEGFVVSGKVMCVHEFCWACPWHCMWLCLLMWSYLYVQPLNAYVCVSGRLSIRHFVKEYHHRTEIYITFLLLCPLDGIPVLIIIRNIIICPHVCLCCTTIYIYIYTQVAYPPIVSK